MIILHDSGSSDLSHVQAMAEMGEGFGLFDYVRMDQQDGKSWIGQIVQPNQNISTVGDRLAPTILHGLKLMQSSSNIQSVQSVQIFDILILGQYENGRLLTPRIRPLPGAIVSKLDTQDTMRVIEIPSQEWFQDDTHNVIGELLNADGVPLCITEEKFNYHIMVAGGTGSGKSNVSANLILQATKYGKCVLIHDAKPDYGLIESANSDRNVEEVWSRFERYGISPQALSNVIRIGFYGNCDPNTVTSVVGFRASDFYPEMLAGLFFTDSSTSEQNAFEGFVAVTEALRRQIEIGQIASYSVNDILTEVARRSNPNNHPQLPPNEVIHSLTGPSIQRKVNNRIRNMRWLDAVGKEIGNQRRAAFGGSRLDSPRTTVETFNLERFIQSGRAIVIDYSHMDEQAYALILSYFLRECQNYRRRRGEIGIVQMVDEAHRVFDNESRHSRVLGRSFERVMREGRSVDHSIILSLQNASQIPPRVMNNLNTKFVLRQNSKQEADAATQTMGRDFSPQAMRLGTGHALVSVHESRATVLAQMCPSPFDLMRNDNTPKSASQRNITPEDFNDE